MAEEHDALRREEEAFDAVLDAALKGRLDAGEMERALDSASISSEARRQLQCMGEALLAQRSGRPGDTASLRPDPALPFESLGGFRLLRRIGEGGMGVVYLAEQASPSRLVALKVLRGLEHVGAGDLIRFRREIDALGRVRHPHVVSILAAGEDAGVSWFAMELIGGEDLDRRITNPSERPSLRRRAEWIRQVATALQAVHDESFVHRDVKPANIRIGTDDRAILMDFGLSRATDSPAVTAPGAFFGTSAYAAPEQVDGRGDEISPRTDLYALGVTLFEVLTGRLPSATTSDLSLPAATRALIDRATRPDPAERPATASVFADELAAIIPILSDESMDVSVPASRSTWDGFLARIRDLGPVFERFHDQGEVARGGMGTIRKVTDENLRRTLAMKVMSADATGSERPDSSLGRFLDEAQLTSQLDHPGIVPVHDIGLDERSRVYFTMKLVEGVDLRAVFERVLDPSDDDWTEARALNVLLRVCEAMSYAHEKGVIHRDLKPGNVMVGRHGETYVMDWGVAKVLGQEDGKDLRVRVRAVPPAPGDLDDLDDPEESESPMVTMDGDVLGTPAYMPPEQAAGRIDEMGPLSDVYAVGAMLYHLLTGRMPYVDPEQPISPWSVLTAVMSGPPRPISELRPDCPAELQAIAEKAMAPRLDDRYANMESLARDLRAFLENRVVEAYEFGAFAELRKWVVRNRGIAATVAVALFLIAGSSTLYVISVTKSERKALANEQRADRRAAELERLSDVKTLADLKREIDQLWPATMARVGAMDAWLTSAREVVLRRPRHERTLEELRRQGSLEDGELALDPTDAFYLEQKVEFETAPLAWWHETLVTLVGDIRAFASDDRHGDTMANIEERRRFAATIRDRSIESRQAAWNDAIASIRDPGACPEYDGLVIGPQLGLVPIGRDPKSGLWEFWHLHTGDQPSRSSTGELNVTAENGLVFVLIPGATFRMGAQSSDETAPHYDRAAQEDESAAGELVEVTLRPFFLSKYEMTQAQWREVSGVNPSQVHPKFTVGGKSITLSHPVEWVSWEECNELLKRLELVLPTEAQWEYACRAGTDSPWWCGRDPDRLDGAGNLADRSLREVHELAATAFERHEDGHAVHAPVGSFDPNPFGLHDVIGNVWEWCLDGYGSYSSRARGGDGKRSPRRAHVRVTRGAGYSQASRTARTTARNKLDPGYRHGTQGVRPAREVRE